MNIEVGTIVKLKVAMLGNPIGTKGVTCEKYIIGNRTGVTIIFGNGQFDGFSEKEQPIFLEVIGFSKAISAYIFTNVTKLSKDFRQGVFNHIFSPGK